MNTIHHLIKKHALLIYFVLAFALSWLALFIVMGPEGFFGRVASDEALMPFLFMAILIGPTVAGLAMTAFLNGRSGLRDLLSRLLKWRVHIRWYAVAILTAPLLIMGTLFLLTRFSADFSPSIALSGSGLAFLLSGIMGGLAAGIFEELGWTGFAVPQLRQRHGILATGIIVGLLWGAWHFPLFAASRHAAGAVPALFYLAVLLFSFLPAYRVLMVWVTDRTGSLLVAILMHTSLTASTLIFQPAVTGAGAVIYNLTFTAALWIVVAAVAWANGGQLSPATDQDAQALEISNVVNP